MNPDIEQTTPNPQARRSFHARAASSGWGARLQRRYLGLSLATHIAVLGLTGAVTAVVIGAEESQARGPVAVRVQPLPEPTAEDLDERFEDVTAPREEPVFPEPEDQPPTELELPEAPADEGPEAVLLPDVLPLGETFPELAPPATEPPVEEALAPVEAPDQTPEVVDVAPVLVDAPPPDYPVRARRAALEGSVDCVLVVEADGSVSAVRVLRSSGHVLLDDAAVAALRSWRFRPGLVAGLPGRREVEHRVTFQLDG